MKNEKNNRLAEIRQHLGTLTAAASSAQELARKIKLAPRYRSQKTPGNDRVSKNIEKIRELAESAARLAAFAESGLATFSDVSHALRSVRRLASQAEQRVAAIEYRLHCLTIPL